ncbi:MAG: sigma-70 family RNA polymerase sigma factor [Acidimicrobiia bacterium]
MLPEQHPRPNARSPERDRELSYLLGRAARGDGEAFAQLYDRTSGAVYGLALRMLGDREIAAEVTQEVYVEIWQQATRFDPGRGSVMTWIAMIGHRRAVDRVRRDRARSDRQERAAQLTAVPMDSPSDELLADEERVTVRAAVDRLPALQREALTLAYFGGHTYPEVATLLGIPLGTAKTRIRQGLQRLREQMELVS